MQLRREPPAAVRRELRQEVGYVCPVEGCSSPYLTWHHFDPPWHERQHHDAAGMVALCRDHHPEADSGAFTPEQLREFKVRGRAEGQGVGARINWMRSQLVAVVGGNFYLDCPIAVRIQHLPVVWFGRDEDDNVLVNLQQLTTTGEPRMVMLDNFWITEGAAEHDIECPPSGRIVKAKYPNGDRLGVEFQSHDSLDEFNRRFPPPSVPALVREQREEMGWPTRTVEPTLSAERADKFGLRFPLTTVAIEMNVEGAGIKLGARSTEIGTIQIVGAWVIESAVGVQIGDPAPPPDPTGAA